MPQITSNIGSESFDQQQLPSLPPLQAKFHLVEELQRGWTDHKDEILLRDIFLSTYAEELSSLKLAIDQGADRHHLCKLIFEDIDNEEIRREILAHFATEAKKVSPIGRTLSDLDDTVFSSIHDTRLKKGEFYPGSRQFLKELGVSSACTSPAPTFITARPSILEGALHESLREDQIEYTSIKVGSLSSLLTHKTMAERKLENLYRLIRVFPEHRFYFVGDNGQGDPRFANNAIAAYPSQFAAAFIHRVKTKEDSLEPDSSAIHFFDTYVGAARIATALGLISEQGFKRVYTATLRDLQETRFSSAASAAQYLALIERDSK